jgi:hypothetical protein
LPQGEYLKLEEGVEIEVDELVMPCIPIPHLNPHKVKFRLLHLQMGPNPRWTIPLEGAVQFSRDRSVLPMVFKQDGLFKSLQITPNLRELSFSGLSGIPPWVFGLKLDYLFIGGAKLPFIIRGCTQIQHLHLSSVRFEGFEDSIFRDLTLHSTRTLRSSGQPRLQLPKILNKLKYDGVYLKGEDHEYYDWLAPEGGVPFIHFTDHYSWLPRDILHPGTIIKMEYTDANPPFLDNIPRDWPSQDRWWPFQEFRLEVLEEDEFSRTFKINQIP